MISRFHATGLFLYPLKTSENLSFFDVFSGYRKRPMAVAMINYFFDFVKQTMQCPATKRRHFSKNSKKQSSAGVLNSSCYENFTCSLFYKAYRTLAWIITEKDSVTDIFPVQFSKLRTPPVGCIYTQRVEDVPNGQKILQTIPRTVQFT